MNSRALQSLLANWESGVAGLKVKRAALGVWMKAPPIVRHPSDGVAGVEGRGVHDVGCVRIVAVGQVIARGEAGTLSSNISGSSLRPVRRVRPWSEAPSTHKTRR